MENFYKKATWLKEAEASEDLAVKALLEAREAIFKAGLNTLSVQKCIKGVLKEIRQHSARVIDITKNGANL
jgi:hypothetical protein